MKIRIGAWAVFTAVLATTLYVLALRSDFYEATSPHWLIWHVGLRKFNSIVAFAAVAFSLRKALAEAGATRHRIARCIVATALYSASIELGQWLEGSDEGLGWNAIDTLCGAAGGAIATADLWLLPRARG